MGESIGTEILFVGQVKMTAVSNYTVVLSPRYWSAILDGEIVDDGPVHAPGPGIGRCIGLDTGEVEEEEEDDHEPDGPVCDGQPERSYIEISGATRWVIAAAFSADGDLGEFLDANLAVATFEACRMGSRGSTFLVSDCSE